VKSDKEGVDPLKFDSLKGITRCVTICLQNLTNVTLEFDVGEERFKT
jgi:hypothetical protein